MVSYKALNTKTGYCIIQSKIYKIRFENNKNRVIRI